MNGEEQFDLGEAFSEYVGRCLEYVEADDFPHNMFGEAEQEAATDARLDIEDFHPYVKDCIVQLTLGMQMDSGTHFYDPLFAMVWMFVFPLYLRGLLLGFDAGSGGTLLAEIEGDTEEFLDRIVEHYGQAEAIVVGQEEFNPFN